MPAVSITPLSPDGVTPVTVTRAAAAADGNAFAAKAGRTLLLVRNTGLSDRTVTITPVQATRPASGVYPALTVPDITGVVSAGAERAFGPFAPAYMTSAGVVTATYDDHTDLEVAALTIP